MSNPLVFLARLIPVFGLLAACSPPYPRGSMEQLYPEGARPRLVSFEVGGRAIGYAERPGSGGPRILFIHGSPGDWKAFADYLGDARLQAFGNLIAVDRPGFGTSGAVEPDLAEQARLLAPLLDGHGAPSILVGHSLGGAIALRMALDHPERVRGVLLIAASVAPELEAPRWYNRLASWKIAQWMIPDALLDSNRELYGLQDQLRLLDAGLQGLRVPVYAIQGQRDRLVDPRTADYLDAALPGSAHRVLRMADAGHFVVWERHDEIVTRLLELIEATAPAVAERTDMKPGPDPLGSFQDAGLESRHPESLLRLPAGPN